MNVSNIFKVELNSGRQIELRAHGIPLYLGQDDARHEIISQTRNETGKKKHHNDRELLLLFFCVCLCFRLHKSNWFLVQRIYHCFPSSVFRKRMEKIADVIFLCLPVSDFLANDIIGFFLYKLAHVNLFAISRKMHIFSLELEMWSAFFFSEKSKGEHSRSWTDKLLHSASMVKFGILFHSRPTRIKLDFRIRIYNGKQQQQPQKRNFIRLNWWTVETRKMWKRKTMNK